MFWACAKIFPWENLCTCQDLLNKALNQKKCKNEKSIKFDFIYEKVILDYHNVLFNLKHCSQKVTFIIKKTRKFFKLLITDLKSVQKTRLKTFTPRRAIFK